MTISLSDTGKRFNREWIFRHFTYEFTSGYSYAITGPNGSGKSTLLQIIGGAIGISEGKQEYRTGRQETIIDPDNAFQYISIAAPYLDVIEEMTFTELLHFHSTFKPLLKEMSIEQIIDSVGLHPAKNKQIRYYSSGMKQRVKLAQAIFSDVPCILLDEPCSNLDIKGIQLYQQLINDYCKDRLVIVCSNDEQEYKFCQKKIDILDYKLSA